jgi:hypothetical protein
MQAPRRRRWPKVLGVLAGLFVIAGIWINAQLEPSRLATTVLGQAGKALQLQLSFNGKPDYAFRPEPRLVLPGFVARSLDGRAFLSATRAEVSLPWSSITGGEPVITRVELDSPNLDVPGLQAWLATRPPSPFKLPTLKKGISVKDGVVDNREWSLRGLSLSLPHLREGDAANLEASATYVSGKTQLPFKLQARLATPGLASTIDLDAQLTLPDDTSTKANLVSVSLLGKYEWSDPRFSLEAQKLGIVANSPLPSFSGKGRFASADAASLVFDAVLGRWPQTWPKLPPSLAAQSQNLPVHLEYSGKKDFSDPLKLATARPGIELTAAVRVPEMRKWLAADAASPLPPLQATLKAPALEFEGVRMEGVEVQVNDPGEAKAAP